MMTQTTSQSRELAIVNKLGLHARAAAKLVTLAGQFDADIVLRRDGRQVNGKSMMGVLMLAAAQGTVITAEASGADASAALDALATLVADRFGEEA